MGGLIQHWKNNVCVEAGGLIIKNLSMSMYYRIIVRMEFAISFHIFEMCCILMCWRGFSGVHTCTHTRTQVHTRTHTRMHIRTHKSTRARARAHTHTNDFNTLSHGTTCCYQLIRTPHELILCMRSNAIYPGGMYGHRLPRGKAPCRQASLGRR